MSLDPGYVKAIEDWLKWYNYHASTLKNAGLEQRVEFCEKGIKGAFIILAGLTTEVERVDLRDSAPTRHIQLPFSFR